LEITNTINNKDKTNASLAIPIVISRLPTMGDFSNFGGSDEENAEIKRLNLDVVSVKQLITKKRHCESDVN
jgi:hypothetical protein